MRRLRYYLTVFCLLSGFLLLPYEVVLHAAITVTEKLTMSTTDNCGSGGACTAYVTNSGTWTTNAGASTFSLATNELGVCFAFHTDADLTANEFGNLTQTGQTWTLDSVANQPQGNSIGTPVTEVDVWTSPGTGSSAAALTMTYGDAHTGLVLSCFALAGAKLTCCALQNKTGAADGTSTGTVTMDNAMTAGAILMFGSGSGSTNNFNAEAGYATGAQGSYATPAMLARVQYRTDGSDSTPTLTLSSGTNNQVSYAVELPVAVSNTCFGALLLGMTGC